jgi:hypothetical protein
MSDQMAPGQWSLVPRVLWQPSAAEDKTVQSEAVIPRHDQVPPMTAFVRSVSQNARQKKAK